MADELVERLVHELAALRARVAALERQEGLVSPVGASQIADGAVTTPKVADGGVTSAKITSGAITTVKIADAAVTAAKIAGGAVGTSQIADSAVTAAKIANAAVTSTKIADGMVTAAKIADGACLAEILDDDGHGSGLDADKLDGMELSAIRGAGAIVKRTTTQTIPNSTITVVSFDTELVDIGDCFNPNQPDRITAPTNGVYILWAQVRWAANTSGDRDMHIRIAGTNYIMTSRIIASSSPPYLHVSGIWHLQSGQIVQVAVYQTSGGNLNIEPYSGEFVGMGVFRLY